MLNTITWFMEKGLEVACLIAGIWLFGYICRHGTGAIKSLIQTIGATVKALCEWIQQKVSEKKIPFEETEKKKPEYEVKLTREEFEDLIRKREEAL